jgi:2-methylcitrate dehydratase PrpD
MATTYNAKAITEGLSEDWALRRNTYKPFPCVHVSHAAIEAAIRLHDEFHPLPEQIGAVRLNVAPSVIELCGQRIVDKGAQSKFSIAHCAAVGLVRGRAGLQEFTDAAVNDPMIGRVRTKTTAEGDGSFADHEAHIQVELIDGRTLRRSIEASSGTPDRSVTDRQLERKFREQGMLVLPAAQVDDVLEACWRIDALEDVGALVRLTVPASMPHAMSQ